MEYEQNLNSGKIPTQQQSLDLINEMISKAKKSYVTKGTASIVWGLIIMICSLVTWAQEHYKFRLGFDIWILTLVALVPQILFSVKESRSRKFTTYEGTSLMYVWMAFGISIFTLSIFTSQNSQISDSPCLFMMLYAIPTFITGGITKFKPMIFGGFFCWAASIVSIFTTIEVDMLLMAACGLFAWLIPGIMLWGRYKKSLHTNV